MARIAIIILLLSASAAFAQQTPSEQALGAKLLQEIQGSLTCSTSVIMLQAEIDRARARIKELEAKLEEKK
jgi:type IV secretory pathway VirB2 component (pilin)